MRVDNVINGLHSVGFNENKGINRDRELNQQDEIVIKEEKAAQSEIKAQGSEDIASRNVKARAVQDEVTMYQVGQAGLRKQMKVLENTANDIKSGKYTSISDVNEALKNMKNEIDAISDKTTYSGEKLFEGNENAENFQIPSVRLGGKNYLPLNDLSIETQEDLNNALSTIQKAITKIDSEISSCGKVIDEKTHQMTESGDFTYVDANYARELMRSLKSEIYQKGQEAISKSQDVSGIM